MKFSDEAALMFLMKSILLTEWIRGEKNAFSQHKGFSSLTKYISSPDVLPEFSIIPHVCH